MSKEKEVITWLDTQINALKNFKFGGKNISFLSIKSLPNVWTELEKGCSVKILEILENKIILQCKMVENSVLKLHNHDDCDEFFKLNSGIILDKVSNIILNQKNPTHIFTKKTWHEIICIEDADITITCKK